MLMTNTSCTGAGTPCTGREGDLEGYPLAMVYAPKQYFRKLYTPEEAMAHGTLFEELYLPILSAGGERK